jgi:hypothetical protein
MMNKKASAIVWILLIILLVVIIGIIAYFLLFNISETKAREIIKSYYNKNPELVCRKFIVNDDNCASFVSCYSNNAINAMPKNLLVQFAKDIKSGKSSAIDSYSLINGKQIGEDCISEILNIPSNINVNLPEEKYSQIPEQIKQYLILEDLGICKFDHSSNFTIQDYQLIMATYQREGLNDANQACSFDIKIYTTNEKAKLEFDKIKSEQLSRVSNPTNKLLFSKEKTLKDIYVLEIKNTIYSPTQMYNYWVKDNYVLSTRDLIGDSTETPVFDAYFDKYS